jgi:aldose 1-epimerase
MGGGEVLAIRGDDVEVELLPDVGARLHRLRAFGIDLLHAPADVGTHRDDPFYWGGFVMAPWCNRVEAAPTAVAGREIRLASNFRDGSAIHGQVYVAPWSVEADRRLVVQGGGDGWPWPYRVEERVTVDGAELHIELALTNLADGPMPAGIGLHPWLRRPLEVRIAAPTVVASNTDPAATIEPATGDLDLQEMRPIPDDLDAAWPDPGDPAVELRWPGSGIKASLRLCSSGGAAIVAASPAGLGAVAIEPQTHLPQGIGRLLRGEPGALDLLAPHTTLRLAMEWHFRR